MPAHSISIVTIAILLCCGTACGQGDAEEKILSGIWARYRELIDQDDYEVSYNYGEVFSRETWHDLTSEWFALISSSGLRRVNEWEFPGGNMLLIRTGTNLVAGKRGRLVEETHRYTFDKETGILGVEWEDGKLTAYALTYWLPREHSGAQFSAILTLHAIGAPKHRVWPELNFIRHMDTRDTRLH